MQIVTEHAHRLSLAGTRPTDQAVQDAADLIACLIEDDSDAAKMLEGIDHKDGCPESLTHHIKNALMNLAYTFHLCRMIRQACEDLTAAEFDLDRVDYCLAYALNMLDAADTLAVVGGGAFPEDGEQILGVMIHLFRSGARDYIEKDQRGESTEAEKRDLFDMIQTMCNTLHLVAESVESQVMGMLPEAV